MTENLDLIIVGAGPAGLCAAMYAGRGMLKAVVLERGIPGGELLNTEKVEDYPGFLSILGRDLAAKMAEHAEAFGADIRMENVESIRREADGTFKVETSSEEIVNFGVSARMGAELPFRAPVEVEVATASAPCPPPALQAPPLPAQSPLPPQPPHSPALRPLFVIEADEYDTAFFDKRSKFVHYRPRTAVLNNLEYDHADIFDDLAAIERQFHHLVRTMPSTGRVVVAVARNESKHPLFTLEERKTMVRRAVRHLPNVEADAFTGLLIHYAERKRAQAVIRGLRAVSDFEFEFQLALMNRKLNERIETIFMMPKDTYTFLSSRIVKEIASLGGDVSAFVPTHVRTALLAKFGRKPA